MAERPVLIENIAVRNGNIPIIETRPCPNKRGYGCSGCEGLQRVINYVNHQGLSLEDAIRRVQKEWCPPDEKPDTTSVKPKRNGSMGQGDGGILEIRVG